MHLLKHHVPSTDHIMDHKIFQCTSKVKITQFYYLNNKRLLEINIETLKKKNPKLLGYLEIVT